MTKIHREKASAQMEKTVKAFSVLHEAGVNPADVKVVSM